MSRKSLSALVEDLRINRPIRVADVGANPLETPVYSDLLGSGICHLIGFEPQPKAFKALMPFVDEHTSFIQAAVGDGSEVDLHLYPASGFTSIFPLSRRSLDFLGVFKGQWGNDKKLRMPTYRLDDLDKVPELDALKMDVQGAEVMILKNGRQKLKSAVCVIVEMRFYRLYEQEPMLHDLDKELRDQGFVLHKFLHQKAIMLENSQVDRLRPRRVRSQLVDGDAVYIRSLEQPEEISDEQLQMLAISALALFESHDLVIRCLDLLTERGVVDAGTAARYVDNMPEHLKL